MNIMLRLKNITVKKNMAEADYSPEESDWWGHISVDLESEEMIADQHQDYGMGYLAHAKWKLLEMAREKCPRTECVVMWY